jgi:hypothetical protein
VHQNLGPLPVYAWGASDLFAGVGSPLTFFSLGGGVHGQTIHPLAGAQGVAGFSSTRAANQAALVEGNAGRTLLNGFLLVEAAAAIAADQLTSNETLRFFPLRITGLAVTNGSATLNWISLPGRNYQVQFKPFLNGPGWTNLGASVTASNTTAQYEDAGGGAQRFYRVVIAP